MSVLISGYPWTGRTWSAWMSAANAGFPAIDATSSGFTPAAGTGSVAGAGAAA